MPWGAVAGAVVSSVASSALSKDKNGGAGTSTASKEPWSAAAPWLEQNIKTGQDLQSQYQATPFNAQQLAAYGNMGKQTNYMNNLVPDLLGQISNQSTGFDRSNTNSRVTPYTFNGAGYGSSSTAGTGKTNLLDQLANPATPQNLGDSAQYTSAANPPAPAPAPAPAAAPAQTTFQAYDPGKGTLQDQARLSMGPGFSLGTPMNGGYGSFNYGDAVPEKNTQAYLDYQNFLLAGGDTMGRYTYGNGNAGNGGA